MKTHDFHVRAAVPDDAAALIDHVHRLCDEPGVCITLDRDEFTFTIDQERQFVSEVNASDNSVFLVAEAAGGGDRPARRPRRQARGDAPRVGDRDLALLL